MLCLSALGSVWARMDLTVKVRKEKEKEKEKDEDEVEAHHAYTTLRP